MPESHGWLRLDVHTMIALYYVVPSSGHAVALAGLSDPITRRSCARLERAACSYMFRWALATPGPAGSSFAAIDDAVGEGQNPVAHSVAGSSLVE